MPPCLSLISMPSSFAMQAKSEDSVDALARKRLRELRMQRGLTLEDVATKADIDVSTLSRLESPRCRSAR